MVLTLVVACLTSLGKVLAPSVRSFDIISRLAALGVCYAAVAVTSVWALLGLGNLVFRAGVVMLLAITIGNDRGLYHRRGGRLLVLDLDDDYPGGRGDAFAIGDSRPRFPSCC